MKIFAICTPESVKKENPYRQPDLILHCLNFSLLCVNISQKLSGEEFIRMNSQNRFCAILKSNLQNQKPLYRSQISLITFENKLLLQFHCDCNREKVIALESDPPHAHTDIVVSETISRIRIYVGSLLPGELENCCK